METRHGSTWPVTWPVKKTMDGLMNVKGWANVSCLERIGNHPPPYHHWVVVSIICYFHPYLGKWSNLTGYFSDGLKPPTRSLSTLSSSSFSLSSTSSSSCLSILVATSRDLTPNDSLGREMGPRKFQGNLGWRNIISWPDPYHYPPGSLGFQHPHHPPSHYQH